MTVPSINMSHFLHFTTWQAGQTRKGFTNLPLHVGDSQTLFHTSCGYAFLQNAELLSRQYPENQKSRSQEPTKSTPDPECQSCIFWFSFKRQLLVFTFAALPKKYFFRFHRSQAFVLCGIQSLSTQDFLQKDTQSVSSLFSNPLL